MTRSLAGSTLLVILTLALSAGCAKKPVVGSSASVASPPPGVAAARPQEQDGPLGEARPPLSPVLEPVFFGFDSARLEAGALAALERNARALREHPDIAIVIEGHCDERGTDEYNLALGELRARAVCDYLVELGIAAGRLRTISYGKHRPFSTGRDEPSWSQNRRSQLVAAEASR